MRFRFTSGISDVTSLLEHIYVENIATLNDRLGGPRMSRTKRRSNVSKI